MSNSPRRNQFNDPIAPREKRVWRAKFAAVVDAKVEAEENILVAIHEAVERGLSFAVIAGYVERKPSRVALLAERGAEILAARKGRKGA